MTNKQRDQHAMQEQQNATKLNRIILALWAILLAVMLISLTGCATVQDAAIVALDKKYHEWVEAGGLAASVSNYLANAETEIPADTAPNTHSDAVPFNHFNWVYGGFNGSGATIHPFDPLLSNIRYTSNGLAFTYDRDLTAWGRAPGDAGGALACLFVQRADGSWVGGKFDWISSSRSTRDFKNIKSGYNGWSLADVPNPCQAAFVIVHVNGKQRSNVISSSWRR